MIRSHPPISESRARGAVTCRSGARGSFVVGLFLSLLATAGCARFDRAERAMARGDRLVAAAKPDEAVAEYVSVLVPGQRNIPLIARLGSIYADQGVFQRARELLGEAVEASPDNFELRIKYGQARLALGELLGARADALAVLKLRPDHPEAPLLLVNASRASPLDIDARRELEQLPVLIQGRAPVLTALAILDRRANNLAAAEAGLRRAVALDPHFAAAHEAFADYWIKVGQPERATASLRAAAEAAPLRSTHVIRWFWHQLDNKDFAGARATAERVLRAHPSFPPVLLAMAFLNARQERADEALQFAERGLAAEFALPGAYLLAAQLRLQRGQPAAAIAWLEKLQRRYPAIPSSHYLRAAAHAAANQPQQARESLRRAMEIDAGLKEVGMLIPVPLGEAEPSDRRAGLERALEIWPESAAGVEALVRLELDEGKLDAANRRASAWVQRDARSARALFWRGKVARAQGDRAAAVDTWQRALEVDPDYTLASLDLAQCYLESDRSAEAEAVIARLLARQPYLPEAMLQQAMLWERAGKFEAARDGYQAVIDRGANSGVAFNNLAWLYAEKFRDLDRALSLGRRARDLLPQSANVADTLGWIHHLRGEYRQALPLLEKSVAETPNVAEGQFRLGRTQVMLGDAPAARRALQRALELGLAGERAHEARRLLSELEQ